ncbi:hypothetical protein CCHR01_06059 [Colletotrichum chrysophilum]|uniref:Uncharacterized protein n=1 Tax=Colletotrichum chrysophilum TaxID=1836956 RepID=A0AAD9AT70_9PEZI|nr:hypothetical protein CCHR01_06059 [Colletotrichum chrysophilum]
MSASHPDERRGIFAATDGLAVLRALLTANFLLIRMLRRPIVADGCSGSDETKERALWCLFDGVGRG